MTEWMPFLANAGLIIGLFAWLRSDINLLRQECAFRRCPRGNECAFRCPRGNQYPIRYSPQGNQCPIRMNARFNAAREETNTRFDTARKETNARFDTARKETGEQFTGLHNDIQAIDVRLARVEATLETTFRLQGILPADRHEQVA